MTPLERFQSSPHFHPRTSPINIDDLESRLGHTLPHDLRDLLSTCGSYVGPFGPWFFRLFGAEDFLSLNTKADIREAYPGYLLIATDGADHYFALDTNVTPPHYVLFPAIAGTDEATDQGPTLNHLLHRIEHDLLDDPPPI